VWPYLHPDLAAVLVPGTARVHGDPLRAALLATAERAGAALRHGAARLVVGAGRVEGVEGDGEVVAADAVLVAAGAWSAAFVAPAGVALRYRMQQDTQLPG